jgi:glycyl-tRNA synthetase beta chain
MANYLLEIGLEEMPAHLVTPAVNQLAERLSDFLNENRLDFEAIRKYSTPRRLAVVVEGLAENSEAMDEEVKGPSAKIAKDAEGNWSKAIQGFSRGQGLTPDDLVLKGDYYFANKHIAGVAAKKILAKVGDEVISKMQFKTYMKWGNNSFLFVRPIQWMISLLDSEVVPFTILDVTASNVTRGHRFLSNTEITIAEAADYAHVLTDNFVMVDAAARKAEISKQIKEIATDNNWSVELTDEKHVELLEEVNNLVEYPTAFVGSFDEKYLTVPEEVLVTSMRDNQRYFEVYTTEGKLAPHFISVRNGNAEGMKNVILGNEKVLVARLEDAEFFWKEDQKLEIASLVKKLENVTFHAKIGSITEHMARTKAIAAHLADIAQLTESEKNDVARAADIYKFDLLTGMVGEFDELQGMMGEKYALLAGENTNVAAAVREHYMPTSAEGALPETAVGSVLAAADKIDSILSFFSAGLIPSGSNDPYALRRAAQGLTRIIEKFDWHFDFSDFIAALDYENKEQVIDFLKGRVQKLLLDKKIRHDIVEATIATNTMDIANMMTVAPMLNSHKDEEEFKPAIENISRVINLAKKVEKSGTVDSELFENDAEQTLYNVTETIKNQWTDLSASEKYDILVNEGVPAISTFFENVMVMAEDERVRNNRLAILFDLSSLTATMADFSLINTK